LLSSKFRTEGKLDFVCVCNNNALKIFYFLVARISVITTQPIFQSLLFHLVDS